MEKAPDASSERPIRLALSLQEVAASTGLCRGTIYKAIAAGTLKSTKVGRRRLFKPADVEAWLTSHGE